MSIAGSIQSRSTPISFARRATAMPGTAGKPTCSGATSVPSRMLGTRDATVGIYLKNETQRCEVYENYVHHNAVGIYLRNDGDTLTEGNLIENNSLVYNTVALGWRDDGMWDYNTAADNVLGWGAVLRWGDETGSVSEFQAATGTAAGK